MTDRDCPTTTDDPLYIVKDVLDLSQAQVTALDNVNNQKGYSVKGNEKTWFPQATTGAGFDLDTSCIGAMHLSW